jgi:DNA-binding CsgD family transcriptional regulator
MQGLHALLAALGEQALQSHNREQYRNAWLSRVVPYFGFDAAIVLSTGDAQNYATTAFNADPNPLARNAASYVAEFSREELARAMAGRTVLDEEIFTTARREQLRAYRDYCIPQGLKSSALRVWMRDGTIYFVFLGGHATAPLRENVLRNLDAVFPVIALGECLQANEPRETPQGVINLNCLSPAEASVVSLARRGLTNREIGKVLGVQQVTVRNQLSTSYHKLGVSNRTQLAYLLSVDEGEPASKQRGARSAVQQVLSK